MFSLNVGSVASASRVASVNELKSCDLAQLEELLAVSKANVKVLRGLQAELRYRRSPQALALLSQIQDILEPQARSASADASTRRR
jgi:hypothetical protein